jgi:hypothetical protein
MEPRLASHNYETLQPALYSRPATWDDLEATTRTIEARYIHLTGRQLDLLQTIRQEWQEPGFNLETDCVFYSRGRQKVGLGVDAQSLMGATRVYEKAGMRSDPLRELVLYEKELRPGLEIRTRALDAGGP